MLNQALMPLLHDFFKQDAPYTDSGRSKLLLTGVLSVFTIFFLRVYNPFNSEHWDGNVFGYVIMGGSLMLFSQFVMRRLFLKEGTRIYHLILFGTGELLAIALMIQLAYGPEFPSLSGYLSEYLLTLKFVTLVIAGPYVLTVWHLAYRYQLALFSRAEGQERETEELRNEHLLTLTGDNGKVVLAVSYAQLLFIKASGNYLEVHFLKGSRVVKQLVRSSFKELEARITDPSLLRIHRSYMVNSRRIASVMKEGKAYKLLMEHVPEEFLPVSLSYKDKIGQVVKRDPAHSSRYMAHS